VIFKRTQSGVVATFAHLDSMIAAIRAIRDRKDLKFRVHSPVPRHEILEAVYDRVSPVRVWTLTGALTGLASAIALTVWCGIKMNSFGGLLVSGKPVNSWPPYMVIMFELTVLLGSLFTLAGFLFHSRLPNIFVDAAYRPEFSDDKFGVFVQCSSIQFDQVQQLLRQAGAEEVHFVTED
jgi:hypothetical protein